MLRSAFLVALFFALCGCGVDATKPESTRKAIELKVPTEGDEKVAPMPREVKREPAKPNDLNTE